ncbi:MAG: HepT-like ribonuclease domain-containing protein [Candidatus Paceibacterota bacterium]|jgi:uncharacterized protein YutE (UPF0331/DUF86 family)
MSKDFILKKISQIIELLSEIEELLNISYGEFSSRFTNIRTAERNFQLIVEQASDINNHIILEESLEVPETYRASFTKMEKFGILDKKIIKELVKSSNLRNILIHEYDFDQDNFIFYKSVKKFIPVYKEYISRVEKYLSAKSK